MSSGHIEQIKSPECDTEQQAVVEHTDPFWSYVHKCTHCQHIILESEWHNVKTELSPLIGHASFPTPPDRETIEAVNALAELAHKNLKK